MAEKLTLAHTKIEISDHQIRNAIRMTLEDNPDLNIPGDKGPIRLAPDARSALAWAVEEYLVEIFHRSLLAAEHRQVATVQVKDMQFACVMSDPAAIRKSLMERQELDLAECQLLKRRKV